MNISFQYANRNNTSVLLKFDGVIENQTICLLVDAGEGVDVDSLIDEEEDEYLTGILLTHLHLDHYVSLDENLRDGAKIYTSEENKELLDTVLSEANSNRDSSFNTQKIQSAIKPIPDGVTIGGELEIIPVPAGHTPGATGFYIEFEGSDGTETILITGDFTRRKVAGYPGLPLCDTDTLILTGATSDNFRDSVTKAVDKALEQGVSGSPALVTASGLNSVHFAYLLGHTIEQSSHSLQVNIVGQAAKLYDALDYAVPNVNSIREYDPENVVNEGCITISGPDIPSSGGSKLLFDEIRDDPNAGLIQLISSNRSEIADSRCTVNQYMVVNHPKMETIEDTIELLNPSQVIVTHQTGSDLEQFRDQFSAVVWAPKSNNTFTFYQNGEQSPPHWVSNSVVKKFQNESQSVELPSVDTSARDFDRSDVNLNEEGLNLDELTLLKDSNESRCKYSTTTSPSEASKQDELEAGPAAERSKLVKTDGAVKPPEASAEPPTKPESAIEEGQENNDLQDTLFEIKDQLSKVEAAVDEDDGLTATTVHVDDETLVLKVDDGQNLPDIGDPVVIK